MRSKEKKSKKAEEWEFFDDCSICRAMKEGRASTEEGLKNAFKEAAKRREGISFEENS